MSPSEAANPFALLMHPEVIVKAMEASDRLSRLHSRVCRPLDRPMIPRRPDDPAAEYDAAIERAAERRA
jgi:hypothetical protein